MRDPESLSAGEGFGILVVDDDPNVCKRMRSYLKDVPKIEVKGIRQPEKIESLKTVGRMYFLIVLDVKFQDQKNVFAYLREEVKNRWPDAITIVLSNYTFDLTDKQRRSVDIVIDKGTFRIKPQIFVDALIKIIPNHKVYQNPVTKRVLQELQRINLPKIETEKELYRITGYVIRDRGSHVEVVISEEGTDVPVWKKVLLPSKLFVEKGIHSIGTPFVFRMYQQEGRVICEANLDESAEKGSEIPEGIEKLIKRIEQVENKKLRKNQNKNE